MNLNHPRRIVNRKYREWIAAQSCLFPGPECVGRVDPAHITPRNGTKGMGSKVSDYRCVPLCRHHHRRYGSGDTCSSIMRVFFESAIESRNKEYDSLFPPKAKRERIVRESIAKHVMVLCECGVLHRIATSKTSDYRLTGAGFRFEYHCPFLKRDLVASFRRRSA